VKLSKKHKTWPVLIEGEKGQAVFELIIFLPLLFLILTLMVTISNSINASINQQKVTRGYFYYGLRGNSLGLNRMDLNEYQDDYSMTNTGMSVVGWRRSDPEHGVADSYAPCFKFSSLFTSETTDQDCDTPSVSSGVTPIVRVYTAYGICSETFSIDAQPKLTVNYLERHRMFRCSLRQ